MNMSETTETSKAKFKNAHNRENRKFSYERLPTPPPDPMTSDETDSSVNPTDFMTDVQFLEYINSLQKTPHLLLYTRSDSLLAPIAAADEAFNHLDKLYKLMEQMLSLRQQNAKLQRRIQDLEHLKNLQTMQHHLDCGGVSDNIPETDDDSSFAESLLDTILTGSKKDIKYKPWVSSRLRQSLMKRQHNTSSSLNERTNSCETSRCSTNREKPAKISKWTKVKAAFRWEKASPSVSGAKSQDSGISGMQPLNYEVARYLRVPSTSEELGISPNDSGAADGSTPGTLSSASSADEIYCQEHKSDLQISDDDRQSITLDEACFSMVTLGSNQRKSSIAKVNANCDNETETLKLSAASDDGRNYTSDHDDLFNKQEQHSSRNVSKTENSKQNKKREIPAYVIARYRQAIAEDETGKAPKRISKWTRVKKAFLTPTINTVGDHKPKCMNYINSLNLETSRDTRLNINENKSKKVQEEIQKNYRQLQKQLSLEFHDKFREWERMKSATVAAASYCRNDANINEQKCQDFRKKMKEWQRIKSQPLSNPNVRIIKKDNLAPEFKKKLEEWQRIKKQSTKDEPAHITKTKKKLGEWPKWRSAGCHKEEPRHHDNQALSDEFIKKLEEWKRIKNKPYESKDKSPSPKSTHKQRQQSTAVNQNISNPKELQWLENELNKIEREKQRLEQEKQNFLLQEERISKLRRTVMGNGNKKDVLIHTQSGYHKFEGISRKFTQRLYEWEKAQGIGPEESTFALLTSQLTPNIKVNLYKTDSTDLPQKYVGSKLVRSKSAESLSISTLIQPILQTSHHPSSLSLNDVDELEKQCMSLSRESSIRESDDSLDKLHIDEPEAVIVEVEDVVEETAAPLEEHLQEKHFPIYQHQKAFNTCEKKLLVEPRIQTIDIKTAEYNHYLIEEIIDLIKTVAEAEQSSREVKPQVSKWDSKAAEELDSDPQFLEDVKPKDKNDIQKLYSDTIFEKLVCLQAIHSRNISDVATKEFDCMNTQFTSPLEAAQDSFKELLQMAEQLQTFLHSRCNKDSQANCLESPDCSYSDVIAITSELTCKLSELKRILMSFYAAFDKRKCIKINQKNIEASTSLDKENRIANKIAKSNLELSHTENTLFAKRMRYRKKSKTMYETDDRDTNNCHSLVDQRNKSKIIRDNIKTVPIDPVLVQKLVIPTRANILNASIQSPISERKPVEVFVKTTRKLFTPLVESQGPVIANLDLKNQSANKKIKKDCERQPNDRPPLLLVSPVLQTKPSKEISPSIRLMLAKYNQMICGKDGNGSSRSAGSSGSVSPVAWRSPVSERRVLVQKERYLEEIRKNNNKSNEVKKSASIGVLHSNKKEALVQIPQLTLITPSNNTKSNPGIVRSTSASHIQIPNNTSSNVFSASPQLKLVIPNASAQTTLPYSSLRSHKIQEAKVEFLNSPVTPTEGSSSAPIVLSRDKDKTSKYPSRSRFSQISMGSESSCDSSACEGTLIKSASAGMIHVEQSTYRNIDPALHGDGYLSLPRSVQKQKERFFGGKLALSNIAAKFRKVKMRRHKDNKKMNTVSALCRQSLVVDINSDSQENEATEQHNRRDSLTVPLENRASSSEDTSPSSSRSGSWIRRSRIFKNL